ncbi:MAG: TRAP transporter substrate-binding protein [Zetaproteobacteria bacterium]|nr:MAG: TRAP transporter substrate-binding protein [Zetaproteobacteria bacterium]
MTVRRVSWAIALLAVGVSLTNGVVPARAAAPVELKWYQPEPVGHPWTDVGQTICDEVAKRSGGRIKVVQFPAGALGTQAQAVDMLRVGSLGILTSGPSILNAFDENVQVFSAPYLFRDREHAYKAFDLPWVQRLFNDTVLKKSGVRTIAFWYFGERNLTTKNRAVMRPEDLKGAKIRSMDIPVWKTVVSSLGANPTPINFTELYMALQTGVVEGQENPIPTIYAQKFHEVQGYIILTRHVVHLGTVHVSEQIWQRLTEADRKMILDVFSEYRPLIDKKMDEKIDAAAKEMAAKGVKIVTPDMDAFKAHAVKQFMAVYGDKWAGIIKEIQAVR